MLDAGPGFNNYIWNYGANTQTITLFSVAQVVDTELAIVFVTDTNGCTTSDTAQVIFDVCNGINSLVNVSAPVVFPSSIVTGQLVRADSPMKKNTISFYDINGKEIIRRENR